MDNSTLAAMREEGAGKFPLETGGILMGYWTGDDVVVVGSIGPGPNAIHKRFEFEPDFQWQDHRCGEFYDKNGGRLTYLGDWHTHPDGPATPSSLDLQCLKVLADSETARTPTPLMIIIGGRGENVGAFVLSGQVVTPGITLFDFQCEVIA